MQIIFVNVQKRAQLMRYLMKFFQFFCCIINIFFGVPVDVSVICSDIADLHSLLFTCLAGHKSYVETDDSNNGNVTHLVIRNYFIIHFLYLFFTSHSPLKKLYKQHTNALFMCSSYTQKKSNNNNFISKA